MTPESRNPIEPPTRLSPRRLLVGVSACLAAGVLVGAIGFANASAHTTPPAPAPQAQHTASSNAAELPTYSLPYERILRIRHPK